MNSFFTQVSSSIRILGWNRDASARATHLKAADGNVSSATIERKSMSTKTSIKRIALVAAAALAIGGFSAVSASAADNTYIYPKTGDGVSFSSVTGAGATLTGVAGANNFVQIGVTAGTSGLLTITGGTFGTATASSGSATVATDGLSVTLSSATAVVNVKTPTVGAITVSFFKEVSTGINASTATESIAITVNAAKSSGVFSLAKSTVYLAKGETSTLVTADATVSAPSTANADTAAATVQVVLADSLGAAYLDSVTATIVSGPGVVYGSNDSTTVGIDSASFKASLAAPVYSATVSGRKSDGSEIRNFFFGIFANGQTGTSVVSFKLADGTVLGSKSIVFAGTTPNAMTVTVKKPLVLNSATATKKVLAVKLYDAAGGNEITTYGGASITGAVATGSLVGAAITCDASYDATAGNYWCSVGAAATPVTAGGTETYSLKTAAGTATATASVKFVNGIAKSISIAGPASADPGSKVTYTLTATDAAGNALPDGAYAPGALLTNANPVANASLTAQPFGAGDTITLVAGVATDYTYAPFGGVLQLSWTAAGSASATADRAVTAATDGTLADTVFTAAGIATGIGASTVTAEDVTIAGNTEATAAANAATDAANQAADAADNATQAAAEALAAVNTLATTVATLIDGIKSQIKALNTLILQIKKKIKA